MKTTLTAISSAIFLLSSTTHATLIFTTLKSFPDTVIGDLGGANQADDSTDQLSIISQFSATETLATGSGNAFFISINLNGSVGNPTPVLELLVAPEWSSPQSYNTVNNLVTGASFTMSEAGIGTNVFEAIITGTSPGDLLTFRTIVQDNTPDYESITYGSNSITLSAITVPEPSTSLFLGLSSLVLLRRSRK